MKKLKKLKNEKTKKVKMKNGNLRDRSAFQLSLNRSKTEILYIHQ